MELSTRVLFPDTYDEIKQRVISEYGQITVALGVFALYYLEYSLRLS